MIKGFDEVPLYLKQALGEHEQLKVQLRSGTARREQERGGREMPLSFPLSRFPGLGHGGTIRLTRAQTEPRHYRVEPCATEDLSSYLDTDNQDNLIKQLTHTIATKDRITETFFPSCQMPTKSRHRASQI